MDQQKPSIDNIVDKVLQGLRKEYYIIGKEHVRAWHAWLILGLTAGIATGVILVANRSGEIEGGQAVETTTACSSGFLPGLAAETIAYPNLDTQIWMWAFTRDTSSANVAFKVTGEFPYSRNFSYQSYLGSFSSALVDQGISANAGSINPFQPNQNRYAEKRSYTVYFVPNGTHVNATNTIQMPPVSASTDYPNLLMRIVLPDTGKYIPPARKSTSNQQTGWVPLPTITAVSNDDLTTPLPCPAVASLSSQLSNFKGDKQQLPPSPENPISFYHSFTSSGSGAPNASVGYLAAQIAPPSSGNIALLRFRIPTFPDTYNYPLQPITGKENLRYMSICVQNFVTTATISCARDDQVLKGRTNSGTAFTTIAVGPDPDVDSSVKAAADKKGYYYLSWENMSDGRILLLYRQVLALNGWEGSVKEKVPVYSGETNTSYYHAQKWIGAYAPVGKVCKAIDFVNGTCDLKISP